MTKQEADFIGSMNMCDEISNEAYKKIMCKVEEEECEDCISRQVVKDMLTAEWTKYMPMELDINLSFVLDKISALPSVTPSYNSVKTELKPRTNFAETSQDTISREALRQKLQDHHDFFVNAYGNFRGMSLSDKTRVDEIDNCIAMVVNAPSVTPSRPKGKWIDILDEKTENTETHHDECSNCGYHGWTEYSYCPNCGSYNGGENE